VPADNKEVFSFLENAFMSAVPRTGSRSRPHCFFQPPSRKYRWPLHRLSCIEALESSALTGRPQSAVSMCSWQPFQLFR
jgi:hypothetical protein